MWSRSVVRHITNRKCYHKLYLSSCLISTSTRARIPLSRRSFIHPTVSDADHHQTECHYRKNSFMYQYHRESVTTEIIINRRSINTKWYHVCLSFLYRNNVRENVITEIIINRRYTKMIPRLSTDLDLKLFYNRVMIID